MLVRVKSLTVPCAALALLVLGACRSTEAEAAPPADTIRIAARAFAVGRPVVPPEAARVEGAPRVPGRVHPRFAGVEVPADCDDPRRVAQVVDRILLVHEGGGAAEAALRARFASGDGAHFAIDLDGTIHQLLDVRDTTRHRGRAEARDVVVLLAGFGAVRPREAEALEAFYGRDELGLRLEVPLGPGGAGPREAGLVLRPQGGRVRGEVNGYVLEQLDFTTEQYESLVRLTATLCRALPRLRADAPRDGGGFLSTRALDAEALERFRGVLGSYHLDPDATGPGPAFDWEGFLRRVRAELERWPS